MKLFKSILVAGMAAMMIFNGKGDMAMAAEDTANKENKITIHLAGDSTVCDWDAIRGVGYYEPQAGWGQMLYRYFDDTIVVKNGAISGYSSKTFYQGCVAKNDNVRHLDELLKDAKEGDYLLVQFGHNDSSKPTEQQKVDRPDVVERYVTPEEYKDYLSKYVEDARAKGVIPVLVTPCARFSYHNGEFKTNFAEYIDAMKELAAEKQVLLVDLDEKSRAYYTELGEEGVKDVFLFCEPGQYPDSYYAKNGAEDKTHFQKFGAIQLARMVAEGLKEIAAPGLAERLNDNVARPTAVPAAPTSIDIVKDKGTMFSFKWDKVEGADLYTVYRVVTMANGKEMISVAKQTEENTCVFTDLEKDKQYVYYVVSKNMKGESVESERIIRGEATTTEKKQNNTLLVEEKKESKLWAPLVVILAAGIVAISVFIFISKGKKKSSEKRD